MRILIDTNILIDREDPHIVSENLQHLLKILNSLKAEILIHPKSIEEIRQDHDENRRAVKLSKVNTYAMLDSPPALNKDYNFVNIVGNSPKPNDNVDNALLYAVYKNAVDFLITEDKGIQAKASRSGLSERVLPIKGALEKFEKVYHRERVNRPPALREIPVHNLEIKDPFFNSLKTDYPTFERWFDGISKDGRKCWVHFEKDDSIGALLIYKIENESVDSTPPLPKKKRLKLCLFKVKEEGCKIGELFIRLSVDYAIKNGLGEIYLTCFSEKYVPLVNQITEYGFTKMAKKENGEDIFIKELLPAGRPHGALSPSEIAKKLWPMFYDGAGINKFVIPIRPEYHNRLFTDYKRRQTNLLEHAGEFIIEGNTIKKAYLSHSRITKISSGDLLLFYRSNDEQELTSIGVVEKVYRGLQDRNKTAELVGKRTVYSIAEIEKIVDKPTLVLLFTWHMDLTKPLKLQELIRMGVLKAAPQSISQLSDEQYAKIKTGGKIDGHFTVN